MLAILSGVGSRRAKLRITRTKTCVLSRAQSYKPLRMGLSRERVGRAPHRPMQASRGWTSHAHERVAAVSTSRMGCHALRRLPRASRAGCRERAAGELRRQGHSTSSRGRERATPGAASRRGREQRARRGRATRAGCAGRGRASAEPTQGPRRATTGTPHRDGRWASRGSGRASRAPRAGTRRGWAQATTGAGRAGGAGRRAARRARGRAGHDAPPRQGRAQAATGAGRAGGAGGRAARCHAATSAAPSAPRSGTKGGRDGEKGAGRAHLKGRRRRGQVRGRRFSCDRAMDEEGGIGGAICAREREEREFEGERR
jgi:hypothetical protein